HADDLRDAAGLGLHLVGEVDVEEDIVAAARRHVAAAEQVDELARVLLARHDQDLLHADALQQLQGVVDHRPAADRQQVLVRDARELGEPRRVATGCDQAFHAADATAVPVSRPQAAAMPRMPAAIPRTATYHHIVASPKCWRINRPVNGAAAQAKPHELPNAPMYAPRMSAGAIAATTACDVGIQSISPITKMNTISTITGSEPSTFINRNGTPISGSATPSLSAGGMLSVQRVTRTWNAVTMIGFTTSAMPQYDAFRWCVVVAEIGSSVSNAM